MNAMGARSLSANAYNRISVHALIIGGHSLFMTSLLLHIIQVIPILGGEVCHICPNENHTALAGDMASFLLPSSGSYMKCSEAEKLAPQGFFSNCTGLHNLAANICECGIPSNETFQCPLCGEGTTELPFPLRVVANKTCEEWQDEANRDFEMDCFSWQKSFGSYCGCDVSAPNHFDGFCRICNDTILSKPNKTVTFTGSNGRYTEFCAFLEQDINTKNDLDCATAQNDLSSPCACGWDFETPDKPNGGDEISHSSMNVHSGWVALTEIFILWCLSSWIVFV